MDSETSNMRASKRWNSRAVGGQRSTKQPGEPGYFEDICSYRYGYETPFIPRLLVQNVGNKKVLEIGVGNGIDAVTMLAAGAKYSGIDITKNHLELTEKNLSQHGYNESKLFEGDLLTTDVGDGYDVVYSFGTLHHISHELSFLKRIYQILDKDGELRVGLYSKYSFFNAYMLATWVIKNRCSVPFNVWQGFISDAAAFDSPITIEIRSRSEIKKLYEKAGFRVGSYYKRGFV